jgi:hypothetical protein
VEPSTLCRPIESFFEKHGFRCMESFTKGKNRIEIFFSEIHHVLFAVVEVYGDKNKIILDFLPWGKDERKAGIMLSSSLLAMLGGGILVQQEMKRRELMETVEKQFWAFLDEYLLEQK